MRYLVKYPIILFLFLWSIVHGQDNLPLQAKLTHCFEENLGQITNFEGVPQPKVKFLFKNKSNKLFLLNNGIAYQFEKEIKTKEENNTKQAKYSDIMLETFRFDMELIGANPNPIILKEEKSSSYTNYYNKNNLNVFGYNKIIYKNIYPNIDWVIHTKNGSIKYDFVVHPGGNPFQIKMKYSNHENIKINEDGALISSCKLGSSIEKKPISFQAKREIPTSFVLNQNSVTFQLGTYDKTKDLIIDPLLRTWGTYYGGDEREDRTHASVDASGNIYITGITDGSTNNIASSGSHQILLGGIQDAFLAKFNSNGVRLWSTYYGGSQGDNGTSTACDASGNVFLLGETSSTNGIATPGSHSPTLVGTGFNSFLVKFNSAGVRQWGTYYGRGTATVQTQSKQCKVDGSGNVIITGITQSSTNISSAGCHQPTYGGGTGGNFDGYLAKFNTNGIRLWATYYGGTSGDDFEGLAIDGSDNIYAAGRTLSTNGIATIGSHQASFGGGEDAFIVKFNSSGVRQWASYYGGSGNEWGYGVDVNSAGEIIFSGNTASSSNIATSGAHQTFFGGNTFDAFLVKFNSTGVRQWATYYGDAGIDRGSFCGFSASGRIYLGGTTTSTSSIATSGSHQTVYGGGFGFGDAFIAEFNASGVRQSATYYGGSGSESVYGMVTSVAGAIYLSGGTASTSGISTSGAHQINKSGTNDDAYLVKFSTCLSATNTTSSSDLCESSVRILSASNSGGSWSIVSGGGSILFGTYFPPNVTADTPVTIRYTDACGTPSDVTFTVNVDNPANNTTSASSICEGSTKNLTGTPAGGTWSIVSGGGSISGNTYTAPLVTSTTNVTVRYTAPANGACSATQSDVSFSVIDNAPPVITSSNATICSSDTKSLTGTPAGGTFTLLSGGGSISSNLYTPGNSPTPTTTVIEYSIPPSGTCPGGSDTITFTVNPSPTASITSSNSALCNGADRLLTGSPTGGTWIIASGSAIITNDTLKPSASGPVIIQYVVSNTFGCNDTASQTINVSTSPSNPTVSASNDSICAGDTTVLTGSGSGVGATYPIYTSATGGTSIGNAPLNVSPTVTTTYYIEASNGGCINNGGRQAITILVKTPPVISITPNTAICPGDTTTVTATGGISYLWNTGSTTDSIIVSPLTSTTYTVIGTGINGCSDSISCTITIQNASSVIANEDAFVASSGESTTNNITINDTGNPNSATIVNNPVNGSASITNGILTYQSNNEYVGLDSLSYVICDAICPVYCDTTIVRITIERELIIPQFISPENEDDLNDYFEILGLSKYPNNEIKIFNRWGNLVYQASPYANDWNGQNNTAATFSLKNGNNTLGSGTYYYILKLNENSEPITGFIQVKK